jgi:hypothetical protein
MKILKILDKLLHYIPLLFFIYLSVMFWFYNKQPNNFELAILIFLVYAGVNNKKR